MKDKKDKIKAGLVTLVVHALLVLFLAFLTLTAVQPDEKDEDGIPVLLGQVEDAAGDDLGGLPASADEVQNMEEQVKETVVEEAPEVSVPIPEPEPEPVPEPEELMTQEQEKSIAAQRAAEEAARKKAEAEAAVRRAAEEAARKKAAEEAARKAAEEAARRKAEEEARRKAEADRKAAAAANSRVAGAFGNAGNKGSSGHTAGEGNQGAPTGNSNQGAATGVGGLGTGTSAQVANRIAVYLAKPQYADSSSEGTIVVSIQVSASGAVANASVLSSTTSSVALKNAAIAAAKQSKFSEGEKTEKGTITYRFKLQ